jgi:hypothetical protein
MNNSPWQENYSTVPSKSDQFIDRVLIGILEYSGLAYIICKCVPLYNTCINNTCVPIYERQMNKDWKYRLNNQSIRMSALKVWQKDVNKYDQHMRKMLAIAEINDLPFEVWGDLIDMVNAKRVGLNEERIHEIVQMFGIPELYTNDIKKEAVEIAMMHYHKLYQELHAIPEAKDAEMKVNGIIALEVYDAIIRR